MVALYFKTKADKSLPRLRSLLLDQPAAPVMSTDDMRQAMAAFVEAHNAALKKH